MQQTTYALGRQLSLALEEGSQQLPKSNGRWAFKRKKIEDEKE